MSHPRPIELLPLVMRDQILERPLPNNSDAERAIIGAIMLDNALVWQARSAGLMPGHCYVPMYRFTLEAMYELSDRGHELNPITIVEELRRMGRLGMAGGMSEVSNMTYGLPHFANIGRYVKMVMDKHWVRTLITTCNMIISIALDDEEQPETQLTGAETAILELVSVALRTNKKARSIDFVPVSEDKAAFIETLQTRASGVSDAIPTGIRPIDAKLEGGGLNPQGLYMIAARPKSGKTSFALGIAERTARSFATQGLKKSVAVASLEMRRLALQMRMFSAYTGIPFDTLLRPGKLRGVEKDLAFAAVDEFFNFPLHITDAVFSLPELFRACERAVYGPAQACLIMVDYLQLIALKKGQIADPDNLTGEVTVVSRELKHMATELNVPVVGISSLNSMGELRQSRTLEYDLEALIRLENPDYKPNMTLEERATLDALDVWDINARLQYQRNGPTGDNMLKFLRPRMQFVTLEEFEHMTRNPRDRERQMETLWETS